MKHFSFRVCFFFNLLQLGFTLVVAVLVIQGLESRKLHKGMSFMQLEYARISGDMYFDTCFIIRWAS